MDECSDVPLRSWIEAESKRWTSNSSQDDDRRKNVRAATVAYAIAELFKLQLRAVPDEDLTIDNVSVRVNREEASWDDIHGIRLISTGLSLSVAEPSYLSCLSSGEGCGEHLGRYLEVELESPVDGNSTQAQEGHLQDGALSTHRCQLFGKLLYQLFSHRPFPDDDSFKEPEKKKTKSEQLPSIREPAFDLPCVAQMQQLGVPVSICLMTQNLLESGSNGEQSCDEYCSLNVVCQDLHLLLLDPERFLFDREVGENESPKLLYRDRKLYGRDEEESLITDAFCRVSRGKSEAFFIGGFSGSGKSKLVNSLKAKVNAVGGYVLMHKFDDMSKDIPLFGVVSALNQLCLMVKRRNTPKDVLTVANKLKDVFGDDCWLLASVLPNVSVFSSDFSVEGKHTSETMNLRSVYYTLLRFVRVISSPAHPIMLVFDDMQWCNSTALDTVRAILSDTRGSCIFFVGTYRDNEVQEDHAIFQFIEKLDVSNVPTTKMSLTGLNQEDLNTMISDALCLYPRICRSLSDVIFQKTKGNPFFVLEFVQSLRDRGLLKYNPHQKRWAWNVEAIQSEEITDNVQHLLSSKLKGLSDNMQAVLKVMACFGTITNESLISQLSETKEYSNMRDGIKCVVSDGFVEKDGKGGFKFVHDKIREAAYNLIPDSDKDQFHYNLGMLLHSIYKEKECGMLCLIIGQINKGLIALEKDPLLRTEIAELNVKAGNQRLDRSDFGTATSYFSVALSLLPDDHWKSMYKFCLTLYYSVAKAAYSSGNLVKAQKALQKIIDESKQLPEKLQALNLLVTVLVERNAREEAFTTSCEVLSNFGEVIPDSFDKKDARAMVKKTSTMLGSLENFQHKIKPADQKTQYCLMFYSHLPHVAYYLKPAIVPYFVCRMTQLSINNGMSKYSLVPFLSYAAMLCTNKIVKNIEKGTKLGRLVMNELSQRFDPSSDQKAKLVWHYYALIGFYSESLQICREASKAGFEAGMCTGDVQSGFLNGLNHIRMGLFSGENLHGLLKETEYYLSLMGKQQQNQTKAHLLFFHETISLLISNKEYAAPTFATADMPANARDSLPLEHCFHKCFQSFFNSKSERCNHFAEKMLQSTEGARHHHIFITFFYALNSFKVAETVHTQKLKAVPEGAVTTLKSAAELSKWNFQNKVELLQAELYHREDELDKSKEAYYAAIASAKKSKFIHEEGLACEKAACHFKKIGDTSEALKLFSQARDCYVNWGSEVKVNAIDKQILQLNIQ